MFKTNFSGHAQQNSVGTKIFRDTVPECPHGYGHGIK